MDSRAALIQFERYLSEYEKSEILTYETVYFFNISDRKSARKPPKQSHSVEDNFGFDNDKNEYVTEEGEHIAYRYEISSRNGKGCFG